MAELTPMMKQYLQIKEQNQDAILFFRLGDFYEMFGDDARKASKELDLTLTTRDKDKNKSFEEKIPMCGIPYHASDAYIARLISRYGLSQEEAARRLGRAQPTVANKLRLLRLPEDVLNAMRNAGLTERHGRALLRLETPAEQREALAYILSRDLNVAATDAYIERLLEAKTAPESEQQKTFILKDVRVFLNTISHSLDLMKQGGIDAGMHRQETDEALILTINIPKARRREPAPKQGEPVPVG